MFRIIFAGKEDCAFFYVREAQNEDELNKVLEEFQDYVMIRGIKPYTHGKNYMSWEFAARKYHLFWSEVFNG